MGRIHFQVCPKNDNITSDRNGSLPDLSPYGQQWFNVAPFLVGVFAKYLS